MFCAGQFSHFLDIMATVDRSIGSVYATGHAVHGSPTRIGLGPWDSGDPGRPWIAFGCWDVGVVVLLGCVLLCLGGIASASALQYMGGCELCSRSTAGLMGCIFDSRVCSVAVLRENGGPEAFCHFVFTGFGEWVGEDAGLWLDIWCFGYPTDIGRS